MSRDLASVLARQFLRAIKGMDPEAAFQFRIDMARKYNLCGVCLGTLPLVDELAVRAQMQRDFGFIAEQHEGVNACADCCAKVAEGQRDYNAARAKHARN